MQFSVSSQHTYPSGALDRVGRIDRVVVLSIDNLGTRTVTLPDETYSETTLVAAVKALLAREGKAMKDVYTL